MKKSLLFILVLLFCLFTFKEAAAIDVGIGTSIKKPVKSLKDIKSQNVVSQTLDYSCGPASLATILSYYFQDEVTEEEIIKSLLITTDLRKVKQRKGFSLLDLKNFAKLKGYEVVGYRMDLEYLVGLDKPVLIPVNIKDYSHFVIFRGLKGGRVFLADPALGNMTMASEKFLKIWQGGIGLVLSKSGEENINSPLKLTEKEKAIFANPMAVRRILGINSLGNIYSQGEF